MALRRANVARTVAGVNDRSDHQPTTAAGPPAPLGALFDDAATPRLDELFTQPAHAGQLADLFGQDAAASAPLEQLFTDHTAGASPLSWAPQSAPDHPAAPATPPAPPAPPPITPAAHPAVGAAAAPTAGRPRSRAASRRPALLTRALSVVLLAAGFSLVGVFGWQQLGSDLYTGYAQDQLADQWDAEQVLGGDQELLGVTDRVGADGYSRARAIAEQADREDHESWRENSRADGEDPVVDMDPNAYGGLPDGVDLGDPVAHIRVPGADVDHTVVAGVADPQLRHGPGWAEQSALPGTPGNAVISGHRTTYGGPFRHLDRLDDGDRIEVEVPGHGTAVFEVRDRFITTPDDVGLTAPTDGVRLTLTTCHPVGSDRERLIVQAELVEGAYAWAAVDRDDWQPYDR